MKWILVQMLVLFSFSAFSQNGHLVGQFTKQDSLLEFKYLTVLLKKEDSIINGAVPDSTGYFTITKVPEGVYTLIIKQLGYRDVITDDVKVSGNASTNLNLNYPPPCNYKYPKGKKPKCISSHTDQIIPIVYGLPTRRTFRRAKMGLVQLGGCIISECDPQYYCKLHKIEL